MSIRVISQIWEHGPTDPVDRSIFVCLAYWANDTGDNCFPSVETIAQMSCRSQRTVQRSIESLEESGWLTVHRNVGRGNTSNYILNLERLSMKRRQADGVSEGVKGGSLTLFPDLEKGDTPSEKVTLCQIKGDSLSVKGDSLSKPPHPLIGRSVKDPLSDPGAAPAVPVTSPRPLPPSTGAGAEFMLAGEVLRTLKLATTPYNMRLVAEQIGYEIAERGGECEAAEFITQQSIAARARGEPVTVHWIGDGKFRQEATGNANRAQQRTNGNLAALTAARQARRDREHAGGTGGGEAGSGQRGELRGLLEAPPTVRPR